MARSAVTLSPAALREPCAQLGCPVPEEALAPLATYLALLTQWNRVMNLVGTRRWQDTLRLLLADSFHLAEFLRTLPLPKDLHTWDLGAGAGLPGIPLRMVWTEGHYYMVEAREKRALFLSTALAHAPLPRTGVFCGRAEDFFLRAAQPAHLVVSRAFMPWAQVLDLVQPHVAQPSDHASAQPSAQSSGARVVFLTLEAAPAVVPQGWVVEAGHQYAVDKDVRHFWCLRYEGMGASC